MKPSNISVEIPVVVEPLNKAINFLNVFRALFSLRNIGGTKSVVVSYSVITMELSFSGIGAGPFQAHWNWNLSAIAPITYCISKHEVSNIFIQAYIIIGVKYSQ